MTRPERWAAKLNLLSGSCTDAAGGLAMPVADRLVIGHADGEVLCVDLASGDTVWTGSERHGEPLQVVTGSPDGWLVATSASDHVIRLWEVATGALVARLAHTHTAYDVRFSPDGTRLATACTDETVGVYRLGGDQRSSSQRSTRIYPLGGDQRVLTLAGHEGWVTAVDWSPRGERIVSVSTDATLRLWDATSGSALLERELGSRSEAVAWSGLDQIAVGLEDGSILLLDASDPRREVARLCPDAEEIFSLQWAAGGRRLAAGAGKAVIVWDQQGAHQLARFDLDGTFAYRVAWSPDGSLVGASLCGDRVRLWDVPL